MQATVEDTTVTPHPRLVPAHKSMFASLKNRDCFYLWVGMVASAFAMNMQLIAQGWLVYETKRRRRRCTLAAFNTWK